MLILLLNYVTLLLTQCCPLLGHHFQEMRRYVILIKHLEPLPDKKKIGILT